MLLLVVFGILLEKSYERSARMEVNDAAQYALLRIRTELGGAIDDSKSVSYDGKVRSLFRTYRETENKVALYRGVNDYLSDKYSRTEKYRSVFIAFWDADICAYAFGSGESGSALIGKCRSATRVILEQMHGADTQLRFLMLDGELYLARNLLDSSFEPYASIVMMLRPSFFFAPLSQLTAPEDISLRLDALCLGFDGDDRVEEREDADGGYRYGAEVDGHSLELCVRVKEYSAWEENPWMNQVAFGAALLLLPLLPLMVLLWRRHVGKPIETLVEANMKVQSGERGYAIENQAPNAEFFKLYEHFNDMSTELKTQFERSYLEQQASQRAQIKALQSQINPHFLNNTLEVINWEARIAGCDRVAAMIEALSTMLDAALDRDGRTQITLREELNYADAYFYIIHERLGDSFRVHKEIDESLLSRQVPRLILQPIAENAVEHDMTRRGGGELWLRVYLRWQTLVIEVEHEGIMTDEDRARIDTQLESDGKGSGSVGILNVSRRLKLIYGDKASLRLTETGYGTILASISFPDA